MSTFKQRLNVNLIALQSNEVTLIETVTHLYNFIRFERAIAKSTRATNQARKYHDRMNASLEVFNLRMEMSHL